MICRDGCWYQCPGTWTCKQVWCPRTVVENVACTTYERQVVRKQVPGTRSAARCRIA